MLDEILAKEYEKQKKENIEEMKNELEIICEKRKKIANAIVEKINEYLQILYNAEYYVRDNKGGFITKLEMSKGNEIRYINRIS